MRSRFRRAATRSGWRGVVVLAMVPVVGASSAIALRTHGTVRSAAGVVYCAAAAVMLTLAWKISFGRRVG